MIPQQALSLLQLYHNQLVMSFTIDNNINDIIYNGNHVQKLIFNGNEIWSKGSPINYREEPFTIISWADSNTITIKCGSQNTSTSTKVRFSAKKDTDTSWTSINDTYSFGLNKGQKLYVKAYNTNNSLNYKDNTSYNSLITGSKYFEVCGNIMSLLYSSDWANKIAPPNTSGYTFDYLFYNSTNLISARNLILPMTRYYKWCYQAFMYGCSNLYYAPKELPANTLQERNTLIWMFSYCSKLQETPVVRLTSGSSGDNWINYIIANATNLKRAIFLLSRGYPSCPTGCIKYKVYGNSSATGSLVRIFSDDPNDYIHIWAEPEIQYAGIVSGCSDYFISGDSVTLEYNSIDSNYTFAGWYENDTLISSNNPYTFSASASKNYTAKLIASS